MNALREDIDSDLHQLRVPGRMRKADGLKAESGQHFNATTLPLYFTGDVAAAMVLVHLNPKQADDHSERYVGDIPTADEYIQRNAHFGREVYGPESPRTYRSRFDRRQVQFLREFGVINFLPETDNEAIYTNLERAIDNKLQMEVVPYGSDNFNVSAKLARPLAPHFARLLDVIVSAQREYVIFCGSVFLPLLRSHISSEHQFRLAKNDGTPTKGTARFMNVGIDHNGTRVRAGIAATYAQQGIPMPAYARECAARY